MLRKEVRDLDKTSSSIIARFNSKSTWITLWVLALAVLILSLRSLAIIKPALCIGLCAASLILCLAGTLVGLCAKRTTLEIKEKLVFCKTLFGKQIIIPFDCVTGIKTSLLNSVTIYSASHKIRCSFVCNRDEIVCAITQKLSERN